MCVGWTTSLDYSFRLESIHTNSCCPHAQKLLSFAFISCYSCSSPSVMFCFPVPSSWISTLPRRQFWVLCAPDPLASSIDLCCPENVLFLDRASWDFGRAGVCVFFNWLRNTLLLKGIKHVKEKFVQGFNFWYPNSWWNEMGRWKNNYTKKKWPCYQRSRFWRRKWQVRD